MAKRIYVGNNNVARKVKKLYVGVKGVARKAKKVYIGVNGVAQLAYASTLEYTYDGASTFSGRKEGDWVLTLTGSGTLVF